jgi:hypothetical protein
MCRFVIQPPLAPRRANALNVEIGQPAPRCRLAWPEEWQGRGSGADLGFRWLASGGDALVFGGCVAGSRPECEEGRP